MFQAAFTEQRGTGMENETFLLDQISYAVKALGHRDMHKLMEAFQQLMEASLLRVVLDCTSAPLLPSQAGEVPDVVTAVLHEHPLFSHLPKAQLVGQCNPTQPSLSN